MIDILAISYASAIATNRCIYRELKNLGWNIQLIVPEQIHTGSHYQKAEKKYEEDPPINFLQLTSYHQRLNSYKGLYDFLNKLRPKIILLDSSPASILAIQSAKWAKKNNSKLICQSCDNILPKYYIEIMKGNLRSALSAMATQLLSNLNKNDIEHIFVISNDGKNIMEKLGFKNRISKIPLGFDRKLFFRNKDLRIKTRQTLGLKETTIAYFGRLNYQKGVHILIKSLESLRDMNWHLLIDRFSQYEEHYGMEIQKQIQESDLSSRIIYFDAKHNEMPAYMNAADIVVVPSISVPNWKEQYGRIVPESMACGKLVIVSNNGALPELIDNAGIIFPEKDTSTLSRILRDTISNPEKQEYFANLAENRAIEFLSVDRQRDLMHNVFQRVLNL